MELTRDVGMNSVFATPPVLDAARVMAALQLTRNTMARMRNAIGRMTLNGADGTPLLGSICTRDWIVGAGAPVGLRMPWENPRATVNIRLLTAVTMVRNLVFCRAAGLDPARMTENWFGV